LLGEEPEPHSNLRFSLCGCIAWLPQVLKFRTVFLKN